MPKLGKMAALDESNVEKKFRGVSQTQESIQSLTLWIIHHKAQHEKIVELWFQVLKKSKMTHRLTMFYLCNDIVQTCKKKHAIIYKDAFKEVLKDAVLLVRDPSMRNNVERIFKIWEERKIYDAEFLEELASILHNTKVRATENSKLLAEFKPHDLVSLVMTVKKQDDEVELRSGQLSNLRLDTSNVETIKQLKDKSQGKDYCQQFEDSCSRLETFVEDLEKGIKNRVLLVEMLEQSELFYDTQYGEAKIVANAYKNFGTRVNNLRKRLDEHMKSLPEPYSPVPSPSIDAPSPGNTPPLDSVDVNFSDEEMKQSKHIPGLGSPTETSTSSKEAHPLLPAGLSADFFTRALQSVGEIKESEQPAWSAAASDTPTTQSSSTNLVQLTEGSCTPTHDEGNSTPVQDEPPEVTQSSSNPIEFLTQLISQSQKSSSASNASFFQNLTALTEQAKKAKEKKEETGISVGPSVSEEFMASLTGPVPPAWEPWNARSETPSYVPDTRPTPSIPFPEPTPPPFTETTRPPFTKPTPPPFTEPTPPPFVEPTSPFSEPTPPPFTTPTSPPFAEPTPPPFNESGPPPFTDAPPPPFTDAMPPLPSQSYDMDSYTPESQNIYTAPQMDSQSYTVDSVPPPQPYNQEAKTYNVDVKQQDRPFQPPPLPMLFGLDPNNPPPPPEESDPGSMPYNPETAYDSAPPAAPPLFPMPPLPPAAPSDDSMHRPPLQDASMPPPPQQSQFPPYFHEPPPPPASTNPGSIPPPPGTPPVNISDGPPFPPLPPPVSWPPDMFNSSGPFKGPPPMFMPPSAPQHDNAPRPLLPAGLLNNLRSPAPQGVPPLFIPKSGRPDQPDFGSPNRSDFGHSDFRRKDHSDFGRKDHSDFGRNDRSDFGRPDRSDFGRQDHSDFGRQERPDLIRVNQTPQTPKMDNSPHGGRRNKDRRFTGEFDSPVSGSNSDQDGDGSLIPTLVGNGRPNRPLHPPRPPSQPPTPRTPGTPSLGRLRINSGDEDDKQEFIDKLKRKSLTPTTPPAPPKSILKNTQGIHNLRNLTEIQPSSSDVKEAQSPSKNISEIQPLSRNRSENQPLSRNLSENQPSPRNLTEIKPLLKNLAEIKPSSENVAEVQKSSVEDKEKASDNDKKEAKTPPDSAALKVNPEKEENKEPEKVEKANSNQGGDDMDLDDPEEGEESPPQTQDTMFNRDMTFDEMSQHQHHHMPERNHWDPQRQSEPRPLLGGPHPPFRHHGHDGPRGDFRREPRFSHRRPPPHFDPYRDHHGRPFPKRMPAPFEFRNQRFQRY